MTLPSGSGNPTARIFLVGEAFGEQEERQGQPFVGTSGHELNRMLQEAGLLRSDCYVSNVVNARPPHNDIGAWIPTKKKDIKSNFVEWGGKVVHPCVVEGIAQLKQEINLVNPQLIITFGNTPLWALTGADGVMKWRGSLLDYEGTRLIPTIHPAAVLRQWEFRSQVVHDLRRAARELTSPVKEPERNFKIRPSFNEVLDVLQGLTLEVAEGPLWLDLDIETKPNQISCLGLSWSRTEALIIPFVSRTDRNGYWSEEEEALIVYALYRLLTHSNCRVRWQNGLYDAQYVHRLWHFIPRHGQDTMVSWHVMFAGQKKSLDYQASLLCDWYVQWKPDKGVWKNGG